MPDPTLCLMFQGGGGLSVLLVSTAAGAADVISIIIVIVRHCCGQWQLQLAVIVLLLRVGSCSTHTHKCRYGYHAGMGTDGPEITHGLPVTNTIDWLSPSPSFFMVILIIWYSVFILLILISPSTRPELSIQPSLLAIQFSRRSFEQSG